MRTGPIADGWDRPDAGVVEPDRRCIRVLCERLRRHSTVNKAGRGCDKKNADCE